MRKLSRRVVVTLGLLLALVPTAFIAGVSYFRRPRSVPPVIVVCCVDARYSIYPRLSAKLPVGYRWQWPGCAKEFVDKVAQREQFFDQLQGLRTRLAVMGQQLEKIVFVDHGDCAWYGEADSVENHKANLRQAAKLIGWDPRANGLSIELCLHDLESNTLALVELDEDVLLEAS